MQFHDFRLISYEFTCYPTNVVWMLGSCSAFIARGDESLVRGQWSRVKGQEPLLRCQVSDVSGPGQGSGSVVRNHCQRSWCQGVRVEEGVRGLGSRGLVEGGGLVDDTGQGVRGQVPGVRAQGSGLCS